MNSIYITLSTSPHLRSVRKTFYLTLTFIALAFAITTALSSLPRAPLAIVFSAALALYLSPAAIISLRRASRIHALAQKFPKFAPVAAYLLPSVRDFIDVYGVRASQDVDQSVIVVATDSSIELWGGGARFSRLCEISYSAIDDVRPSMFDGYRCVQLSIAGSETIEVDLVLCGHVFGIDQRSVSRVISFLNAVLAPS